MLRTTLALLTLLATIDATAQVVSSTEQSYGPYARPLSGYEPALAVAQDGILLAWSEVMAPRRDPQIRIGLLDFHGRLVSPITTIESEWPATSPIVTSDGTSFRVQYLVGDVPFAVDVDARGTPMGSPRRALSMPTSSLVTRWMPGWCRLSCPPQYPDRFLIWTFLSQSGVHAQAKFEAVGQPIAGGTAKHFMLAWNGDSGIWLLEHLDGAKNASGLVPASVNAWEQPAVACDDTHCLLAFATKAREIYGVLIDAARPYLVVPVAIETATRVERPQVHLLKPGRFLVVYVSAEDDPQHRFAGRIVTTAPLPRRRAVR